MLIGPGRWGTSTPSLGVPVHCIFYVAIFDNKDNVGFNEEKLREGKNIANELVDSKINKEVIKVYSTKGLEVYSDIKQYM